MTRRTLWVLLALSFAATMAYGLFLKNQGSRLSVPRKLPDGRTVSELPGGILAFEFAGSECRAAEIVALWESEGLLETARDQVRFDFLFLLLYPTAIALGCALARRHLGQPTSLPAQLGGILVKAQVLTAGFDALENRALLRILEGEAATSVPAAIAPGFATWAGTATIFATLKFGLLVAGLAYATVGFLGWLGSQVKQHDRR